MGQRSIAVACLALLALAACGDDTGATLVAVEPVATGGTSTTTSTTTTVAVTLPNPENPPEDPRAPEPLVAVGTIEIPRIGVTKSMYEGITLTTLDHGPGHWPGTAMPGQQGNVVVAGHRVSHDKPFRNIDQLEPGDDVIFTTDDGRFVYKVTGTEVVYPDAMWIVDQTAEYTATLFACTPPGSTRQRIVIHLAYAPNG
ncbi:MAG: class E sortase [Actinomycetota bacterium]|nr:class E sortase [Actinomycetota bacterium]